MANELDIVLMEAGGWLVGVEANTLRNVRRGEGERDAWAVAALLGRKPGMVPPVTPRACTVVQGRREIAVVFDRILATVSVPVRQMSRVPETLRHFGAPPWWLGTMWWNERLVVLIDLFAAVRARGHGRAA